MKCGGSTEMSNARSERHFPEITAATRMIVLPREKNAVGRDRHVVALEHRLAVLIHNLASQLIGFGFGIEAKKTTFPVASRDAVRAALVHHQRSESGTPVADGRAEIGRPGRLGVDAKERPVVARSIQAACAEVEKEIGRASCR